MTRQILDNGFSIMVVLYEKQPVTKEQTTKINIISSAIAMSDVELAIRLPSRYQ
jgi:hypothetical protein